MSIDIFEEIVIERARAVERHREHGVDIKDFDKFNSRNDWVAYITTYAGRASGKVFSNPKNDVFRENMLKVINLAMSAIEAYDNGYMK